jgi:hypothetical protein
MNRSLFICPWRFLLVLAFLGVSAVVFPLTQEASAQAFSEGVAASDGRFGGKMETLDDWQNLSIQLSESVILGESRVI